MKTIKFLLVSLFMMLGLAAQAQQVVINKTDGNVEVFQPNECDSVVYAPRIYRYYIGPWATKPTDESGLNKTTTSRLTSLTLPADTYAAQAFIYPAEWGTAQFYDENLNSNFGNVKDYSPFPGYNMTQISAAQSVGFGTHKITWSDVHPTILTTNE